MILYKHCVSFSLFKGRKFWTRSPRDFWATTIIAIHRFLRRTNLTLHAAWRACGQTGARVCRPVGARVQACQRAAVDGRTQAGQSAAAQRVQRVNNVNQVMTPLLRQCRLRSHPSFAQQCFHFFFCSCFPCIPMLSSPFRCPFFVKIGNSR